MTDDFTEAARTEAERRVMGDSRFAHATRDLLVGMAEWARDHRAAHIWDEGYEARQDEEASARVEYGTTFTDIIPNPYETGDQE